MTATCQYCGRELPFEAAKDRHEHLHETNAWSEITDESDGGAQ